ncbi:MAG: hypothetical protein K2R98_15320 [Gemmataceae bacterium]|nr:hypothetical protein [Gemmataceae bacterium]
MIELTELQAQAIQGADAPLVRNPRTDETFVLVRKDVYELMRKWGSSLGRVWDDPELDEYEQFRKKP